MKRLASAVVVTFLLSLSASAAWTSPCCDGDYNCDHKVNFQDYIAFVQDFVRGLLNITPSEICGNANIPITGQTASYATGDDGDLQQGVAWPDPRFTDNGDGTITDKLTGSIWLRDANCFGQRTWNEALTDCNGLSAGYCGLTDGSSAGEWRLPNRYEIASLLDMEHYTPTLLSGHPFANVQSNYYWASTTYAFFPSYAWFVDFFDGSVDYDDKMIACFVWPVRGGQ